MLLTNLVVERNASVELAPSFNLTADPMEGDAVPVAASVTNSGAADAGPFTVLFSAKSTACS